MESETRGYAFGEVVAVHLDTAIADERGMPDPARLDIIGRMGGSLYVEARPEPLFEMKRPPDTPASGRREVEVAGNLG